MKVLAILALIATIGFASADGSAAGDYYVGDKHVTYSCEISGTSATCIQNYTEGFTVSAARCESSNWGTGNGKAKKGQCCKTSADCKDTCNGVICGKSW